ncbi:MAG TPA: ribonuclease III [Dehalococcoidia bacterium]|nr:ribonuclease III [Dehalococcoidia bacterium]
MAPGSPEEFVALQERICIQFRDEALLRTAITHPSYSNEHPDEDGRDNERLEFLGDAALGLVVAEALYQSFPDEEEGHLTEWRSQLVRGTTLARLAGEIDLGSALLLGAGEEATGGRERSRNLERVYEALVGAILLDQGLEVARDFIHRTMADEFDAVHADSAVINPKGALQQLAQGLHGRPDYVLIEERGPEHQPEFTVEVQIGGEMLGQGAGASKQLAEKRAARQALEILRSRMPESSSTREALN